MGLLNRFIGHSKLDNQLLISMSKRTASIEDIKSMINYGANPNVGDSRWDIPPGTIGDTPLHYASLYSLEDEELVDLISFLIKSGANPSVSNKYGHTPLHYFAIWRKPAAIRELLNAGANPNVFNAIGQTPLHNAAYSKVSESVKILLGRGAKVNAFKKRTGQYGPTGKTPLYLAVEGDSAHDERMKIIKMLIKAGAETRFSSEINGIPDLIGHARYMLRCASDEEKKEVLAIIENPKIVLDDYP